MGDFINFLHDGTITRTKADGSTEVLDQSAAAMLGGMAGCWQEYVERNKGKPFVPVTYTTPIPSEPGLWYRRQIKDQENDS